MRLIAEMPVNKAARELREHDTQMWRIFHYHVNKAMVELDVSCVTKRRQGAVIVILPCSSMLIVKPFSSLQRAKE